MKKISILLVFCIVAFSLFGQQVRFDQQLSFSALKSKAAKEKKFLFIDCYATWCGPCKMMDQKVYANANVGAILNRDFLSVKVQMDKTGKDSKRIVSWYDDAQRIMDTYKVTALPTFIFINPEGKLVYRDEGFHDVQEFIQICKTAHDPARNFAGLTRAYHNGKLKDTSLLSFAIMACKYHKDSLAVQVARQYKKAVLDKQSPHTLLTPAILPVFGQFASIYAIQDPFIQYVYRNQKEADKGFKQEGIAKRLTDFYITRDLINPVLHQMDSSVGFIEWQRISDQLSRQLDPETAYRNIINAKTAWYQKKKDWAHFIPAWIEKIDSFGIDMTSMWGGVEINNTIYEIIFKHSNNRAWLLKSVQFMEQLLKGDPNSHTRIDTYAGVLYKTGQKQKAIEEEQKAVLLAKKANDSASAKEYQQVVEKMKDDLPTWTD